VNSHHDQPRIVDQMPAPPGRLYRFFTVSLP
jgi:hypothetical protein